MLVNSGIGIMYIPYVLLFILIQYVVRVRKDSKEERQIIEMIKGLR
jgi:preprotein translocase subunit YajC